MPALRFNLETLATRVGGEIALFLVESGTGRGHRMENEANTGEESQETEEVKRTA